MKKEQIRVKPQCRGKVQGIYFLHTSHYMEDSRHSRHTQRRADAKIMLVLALILAEWKPEEKVTAITWTYHCKELVCAACMRHMVHYHNPNNKVFNLVSILISFTQFKIFKLSKSNTERIDDNDNSFFEVQLSWWKTGVFLYNKELLFSCQKNPSI